MPNTKFDSKSFNAEAFKYAVDRVPNLKMNELKKSKALTGNKDIKDIFSSQDTTLYARIAMRGLIDGDAVNYDGETDIKATSTKTYEQGVIVIGRAKGWIEKDFSYDITGGIDFMDNVASQIAEYKDGLDQDTLLAILEGVFAITGGENAKFVDSHTTTVDGNMTATTLNSATNKACGANKKKFALVFMHSDVSTNLENLNLIERLKYTDKDGIQRDLEIGTWNGKLVIVDDSMPVNTRTGDEGEYNEYTTYVLGEGAISYEDLGVKVPFEMARDPKANGGEETLIMRQRKCFAPFGISYEKKAQASLSPTDDELKDGQNWSLVHTGESTVSKRTYIDAKAIPIARIISRG